jgi:acetate kinase
MTIVLSLNTGSSSLKFACYGPGEALLYQGAISRIGLASGKFSIQDRNKTVLASNNDAYPSIDHACEAMFTWIGQQSGDWQPMVIGHRIVHGGPHFTKPQLITTYVITAIEGLAAYAPEHIPPALTSIRYATARYPDLPHVACFDTAFHRTMPNVAKRLPLPSKYTTHGLEKYGFHGLSYEYLVSTLIAEDAARVQCSKIIFAHLGHGASIAAVKNGQCIDTTMGFSPTGGFPMSTRTGDLDPEVVLYLLDHEHVPMTDMKNVLNKKSGLLAISEFSDDMKDLLNKEDSDEKCNFAVEYFIYHVSKHISALVCALGGVDILVFSAGIGEKSDVVRQRICERLSIFGVELNDSRNASHDNIISSDTSKVEVRVIPTNEELVIARQSAAVIGGSL